MEKTITIGGRPLRLRASALIPRLYRYHFRRDMIADMNKLSRVYQKLQNLPADASEEERQDAQMEAMELTTFENVAWLMAKQAGEDVKDSPDEWLDSMDGVFSIYEVLPAILELWGANLETTSIAKKK